MTTTRDTATASSQRLPRHSLRNTALREPAPPAPSGEAVATPSATPVPAR
jgi:hypothetical protein